MSEYHGLFFSASEFIIYYMANGSHCCFGGMECAPFHNTEEHWARQFDAFAKGRGFHKSVWLKRPTFRPIPPHQVRLSAGKVVISVDAAMRIAKAVGIRLHELFRGSL